MATADGGRFSVAMCTYNGERFLREQLESFLRQTRLPDELVVCDDGSSDRTVELLREFASEAPFDVRIEVNERNLGAAKNFEKAIGLSSGEMIALSSFDDVWAPRKLERLEAALGSAPDVGLVLSDARLVDAELRPLGRSLWQARGFSAVDRLLVRRGRNDRILRKELAATYGTTMAFKGRLKAAIVPIPSLWPAEDNWIALVVGGMARIALVPEELVSYRQHDANLSGSRPTSLRSRVEAARRNDAGTFLERAERMSLAVERLASTPGSDGRFLAHVRGMEAHNRARARIAQTAAGRVPLVARELASGRYRRYSNGLRSAAADLLRRRA